MAIENLKLNIPIKIDYDVDLLEVPSYLTVLSHIEEVYPQSSEALKKAELFNPVIIYFGDMYLERKQLSTFDPSLYQSIYLQITEEIKYTLKDYEDQFSKNDFADFDLDLHNIIRSNDIELN